MNIFEPERRARIRIGRRNLDVRHLLLAGQGGQFRRVWAVEVIKGSDPAFVMEFVHGEDPRVNGSEFGDAYPLLVLSITSL